MVLLLALILTTLITSRASAQPEVAATRESAEQIAPERMQLVRDRASRLVLAEAILGSAYFFTA